MTKLNCQNFLIPKEHFYVGVSSGFDSIVLAHFLLREKYNFSIIHINNKFTEEDDNMENSVIKFGKDFNIEVKTVTSIPKDIKENGKEMSCRNTRLNVFKELNSIVLTAHSLSDAVEQHYMNFFRGCESFYPIPFKTQLEGSNSVITRPFMLNSRKEIEEYARENDLVKYVIEDPLNNDQSCKRSWIRHTVIPIIESRKNKNNGGLEINLDKIVKKKVLEQYSKCQK